MRRAQSIYFLALVCAAVLLAAGGQLSPGLDAAGWLLGLVRFLLLAGGGVATVVMWAAAVHIASVHRVAWPLLLTTAIVVCAVGTFTLTR